MNQIQRDITYRRDAVESICEQSGYNSQICQESIQALETQHSTNVFVSKASFYSEIIIIILGVLVLGYFLYYQYLKSKIKKSKMLEERRIDKLK